MMTEPIMHMASNINPLSASPQQIISTETAAIIKKTIVVNISYTPFYVTAKKPYFDYYGGRIVLNKHIMINIDTFQNFIKLS